MTWFQIKQIRRIHPIKANHPTRNPIIIRRRRSQNHRPNRALRVQVHPQLVSSENVNNIRLIFINSDAFPVLQHWNQHHCRLPRPRIPGRRQRGARWLGMRICAPPPPNNNTTTPTFCLDSNCNCTYTHAQSRFKTSLKHTNKTTTQLSHFFLFYNITQIGQHI